MDGLAFDQIEMGIFTALGFTVKADPPISIFREDFTLSVVGLHKVGNGYIVAVRDNADESAFSAPNEQAVREGILAHCISYLGCINPSPIYKLGGSIYTNAETLGKLINMKYVRDMSAAYARNPNLTGEQLDYLLRKVTPEVWFNEGLPLHLLSVTHEALIGYVKGQLRNLLSIGFYSRVALEASLTPIKKMLRDYKGTEQAKRIITRMLEVLP